MDILRIYNETIYDKYKSIEGVEDISSPLLVSSKRYLENVKDKPVMYIGQETNGWVNENGFIIHELDEIEKSYDYFLLERHTSGSIYWQFIKDVLNTEYSNLSKEILWINTLLCGKRYGKGHPIVNEELKRLSLNYLLFLYDYFDPKYVINVSGPNNPYYDITDKFLKKIGIYMDYPNSNNPVIIKDNYIWTYHPMYLRQSKNEEIVKEKIKELIK